MFYMVINKRAHRDRIYVSTSCCTRVTPMRVRTVLVRVAGWQEKKIRQNIQNVFVLFPRLTQVCLVVVAQNVSTHLPGVSALLRKAPPLPASGTAPSPTLKWLASSAPGHLPPKNGRVGVYCVAGPFFALMFWQGAFTPDFARPFRKKERPLTRLIAYSLM